MHSQVFTLVRKKRLLFIAIFMVLIGSMNLFFVDFSNKMLVKSLIIGILCGGILSFSFVKKDFSYGQILLSALIMAIAMFAIFYFLNN